MVLAGRFAKAGLRTTVISEWWSRQNCRAYPWLILRLKDYYSHLEDMLGLNLVNHNYPLLQKNNNYVFGRDLKYQYSRHQTDCFNGRQWRRSCVFSDC